MVGSAPVQRGPSAVAVDPATNTIYVASGTNDDGPVSPGGDTVSVIDGRRCNARDVSKCKGPWPTVKVGKFPTTIAVDQATDTVYVTVLGGNTVAVFNGATCNGQVTWGCHRTPAHVRVGPGPFGIVADDANHTVYVGNPGLAFNKNTMSMINTRTCNGSDLAGCANQKPPAVPVGVGLEDFDVNQATHTVYVGFGNGTAGVAAFDARTCNAMVLSGCGHIGKLTVPHAVYVSAVSVDSANNTIYAADATNTIAAFDGRSCDAANLTGCTAAKPSTVTVAPPNDAGFEVAFWLVLDGPLHTVFVVNQKDDSLSAVNTNVCNGSHLSACGRLQPPTIHTGEDPESVAVNTGTQTLYTANQVTNNVSVIDAATCNATTTRGCRQPPPAIALPGYGNLTAAPAVGTLYAANGASTVTMINTRACNAHRRHGCMTPRTATVGVFPEAVAVDQPTHTVYVTIHGTGKTGTVSVLDERACNATITTGCTNIHTLQVPGGNPAGVAVNPATDTLYVATAPHSGGGLGKPSTVSVFNGATCNATNSSGCGQAPHSVTVGFGAGALAVNAVTDTIYVANSAGHNLGLAGNTVSVLDGATCNATDTAGCGKRPQTITVGPVFTSPGSVAIDPATDTIYIANLENGEGSGTVSVINGATCNATTTGGCGHMPPTVTVGFAPVGIAFDPANRIVAVTNVEDTSVSVIDAATCNATIATSCHRTQPRFPVGRGPGPVAIDPAARTIYTSNGDNTLSIIPATR
jgi:DNA-binding beta-propeller fold protein YncE